jgi:aminopeptidase YwaD
MKYIISAFVAIWFYTNISAQTIDPFYQTIVSNVSYDSVLSNLQEFEALGVKEVGNSELNDTRDWILSKYAALGYTDIQIDTFSAWSDELYNIIVTKTGTLYPDTFVIVDGHYDTNSGTGTNDNGSGTSIILEAARVLKDINTEYSIKFIHFSGEELGMNGSDHYVTAIVNPQNMQIRIDFNIDEVGGVAGLPNDTLKCESDQSNNPPGNNAISDAFTDTLMTLTELYSTLKTVKTNAYGSDYVPFEDNGEIITGYYEYNRSDYVHTTDDFLSHLDTSYVFEIAKAATASTMYFARAYDISVGVEENSNDPAVTVYPNPFNDMIYLRSGNSGAVTISIYNMLGEKIEEKNFLHQDKISLSGIPASAYLYRITNNKGEKIRSGVLIKKD